MGGLIAGLGQEMRVLGIGVGGLGKLGLGGRGKASDSQSRADPTLGGLILPKPAPPMTVRMRIISWGRSLHCAPQDLKSQPEVESSSPLPRLGRKEEALTDTGKMCRQGVGGAGARPSLGQANHSVPEERSRGLGPGEKPGQGGQEGGCTHPSLGNIDASLSRAAEVRPLPEWSGICQSHLTPSPSLSLQGGLSRSLGACLLVVGWG